MKRHFQDNNVQNKDGDQDNGRIWLGPTSMSDVMIDDGHNIKLVVIYFHYQ